MYNYYVVNYGSSTIDIPKNSFILSKDSWDDWGFVTMFHMYYIDSNYEKITLGETKIGFKGQKPRNSIDIDYSDQTHKKLPHIFPNLEGLDKVFFSLGQSPEFYDKFYKIFGYETHLHLSNLNDLSVNPLNLYKYTNEDSFKTSLIRTVDIWQINNQFSRIIRGRGKLTDYDFRYNYIGNLIDFNVKAESSPPTNIHALIGKNGVGKTTILNNMFDDLLLLNESGNFTDNTARYDEDEGYPIEPDYFSKVIYISYSIFGRYTPIITDEKKFSYIGLKNKSKDSKYFIKDTNELAKEFFVNLANIKSSKSMKIIFEDILLYFSNSYEDSIIQSLMSDAKEPFDFESFESLSSGHAIVLLVIVNLIANVIEKTLVLFDEPETHLHPPLLSALIRAINDVLVKKNGVCIFATHSPVVLQEIPKSCVITMHRIGESVRLERPKTETFGENVSTLTHDVFSLEVRSTGFYNLLNKKFEENYTIGDIKQEFNRQLGSEALSLLYLLEHNKHAKLNGYPIK